MARKESCNTQYNGLLRNGIEIFQGIPYGQDTGGQNRFKPPRPYKPAQGSIIEATKPGPACPQSLGQWFPPITLGNITAISEDCLSLNIARPPMELAKYSLPVMVWIHGGNFWVGSNNEPTHTPDGMVLESMENGYPVIHVAINYRLGFFGFAQSETLKKEKSENAGLRDQRLAIEWVRDNIADFGGDPERITIFGQSSGGLAVGMQLLAYGGTKPLPYQRGICESQALEPGITGNFSIDAMAKLIEHIGCNATVHSPEAIACLRSKDTQTLFDASFATYVGDIAHNIGDIWLPSVDGDFLPAAPSELVDQGRFGNATYIFGWTDGDVNFYTNVSIATADDTRGFIRDYLPKLENAELIALLDLYPVGEFAPPPGTNLTAEFYRSARIFRDVLMVCEPIYLAEAMHKKGMNTYFYHFNQTILEPIIETLYNVSHIGVIHSSEFAYIYNNLSIYNVPGYPFNPSESDYQLAKRASSTWSYFASSGKPSAVSEGLTLQNWNPGFWRNGQVQPPKPGNTYVYVIGGPGEGFWALDGEDSNDALERQRLRERCAWINSPEIIRKLQY
ncbi:Alpha/Beta hydrolase protein [Massariosphaeria phaeospora]|uniref:Carboxylic ester hydrolase n=1 Tax=Massariosphaeria phaeospora TaxID=100035 RepID=A0A7C8I5D4_9PLEO|nr:Alpha/Beta hydrolase protein [Massariosphaeria phaeospora]